MFDVLDLNKHSGFIEPRSAAGRSARPSPHCAKLTRGAAWASAPFQVCLKITGGLAKA